MEFETNEGEGEPEPKDFQNSITREENVSKLGKNTFRETVRYHTKGKTLEFETNEGEGEPEPDNAGRKCF